MAEPAIVVARSKSMAAKVEPLPDRTSSVELVAVAVEQWVAAIAVVRRS